jgi:nitrite reductase/ring-hydroxylating ferredoxin subunit
MKREKAWRDLIPLTEIESGYVTPTSLGTRDLAVYDLGDEYTVSHARCSHGGANLCDGYFDGKHIECPLHQGLFDARTGEAKAAPARLPLRMIECRVQDGVLQVYI